MVVKLKFSLKYNVCTPDQKRVHKKCVLDLLKYNVTNATPQKHGSGAIIQYDVIKLCQ